MKTVIRNALALAMGSAALLGASAAVAAGPAAAACAPSIEKAWIRAAPPAATAYAGYAVVRNDCREPFELKGLKSKDFVITQIHETKMIDGSMTMRQAKLTVLPAHALLAFAPNGRHFMLMHPRRLLPAGSVVRIELLLGDGRAIPADFKVQKDAPK